jgi:hypothetical protein
MSNDQPVPETRGVTVEVLATVDLAGEIEGLGGRELRMRMMTMEPGGVFGPLHDHVDRPGTVYVLEGTITDHRDGVVTDYGPGGQTAYPASADSWSSDPVRERTARTPRARQPDCSPYQRDSEDHHSDLRMTRR